MEASQKSRRQETPYEFSHIFACPNPSSKRSWITLSHISIQEGRTVQGRDQTFAALGLFFFLLSHWLHLFVLGWCKSQVLGRTGIAKWLELHRASSLWTTFQKPQLEMCPGNARDGIAASTLIGGITTEATIYTVPIHRMGGRGDRTKC